MATNNYNQQNNSNAIVIKDNKKTYTTTFKNENQAFKINEEYSSIGEATLVDNENLESCLTMYYEELSKDELESYKGKSQGQSWNGDLIKEYNWNNYKGFTYDNHSADLNFIAVLEENDNSVIVLKGKLGVIMEKQNYDLNFKEIFEGKEIQDFLNTMEFKK